MPWYSRVQQAINTLLLPVLLPTQAANLALLVCALLAKRTLCLSELARSYPRPAPEQRRVPSPKHDLLHRLKRLSRFLSHPRVDALAVQVALIPTTAAVPANWTPIWPSPGACRPSTRVESHSPSRSSRGIWRPTCPPALKLSPGTVNGSGLRRASGMRNPASASSTPRLARPGDSPACLWP